MFSQELMWPGTYTFCHVEFCRIITVLVVVSRVIATFPFIIVEKTQQIKMKCQVASQCPWAKPLKLRREPTNTTCIHVIILWWLSPCVQDSFVMRFTQMTNGNTLSCRQVIIMLPCILLCWLHFSFFIDQC